jgi:predicted RNA binding protein YcfA (HicA-like mRNA interferase family)
MVKLLNKLGFSEIRQKGGHKSFRHDDSRTTVIPFHDEDLGRGLIRKILKDIEISTEEYETLRRDL